MSIQLGDIAPDFRAESTEGTMNFHQWLGDSWGILFSHPSDFTPVCTTELGEVARLMPEFKKRNVKVCALSVDSVEDHHAWVKDINETQKVKVNYPIIADVDGKVADLYGMVHPNSLDTLTVRTVFIISPNKKVRLTITYPASTGRNFQEILRTVDSLQLTDKHQLATPVNWVKGEDCIVIPTLSTEEAKKKFGKVDLIKPYLRTTPMPE